MPSRLRCPTTQVLALWIITQCTWAKLQHFRSKKNGLVFFCVSELLGSQKFFDDPVIFFSLRLHLIIITITDEHVIRK